METYLNQYKYHEFDVVHNLSDDFVELILDFQEANLEMLNQYFDREVETLRSREYRKNEIRIPRDKRTVLKRIYVLNEKETKIVATAVSSFRNREVNANPDTIWMYISVLPEYQQQGIGKSLLKRLMAFAKLHNKTKIDSGMYAGSNPFTPKWLIESLKMGLKMREKLNRLYRDEINWDFVNSSYDKLVEKLKDYKLLYLNKEQYANMMLNEEGVAKRLADFYTEADTLLPMEDIEYNNHITTEKDIKDRAQLILDQNSPSDSMNIYMLDGDEFIALSGTYYAKDFPIRDIGTGLTAVRKAYHRKGIATYLKILIIKYYTEKYPEFEYIHTENAGSNEGMLAINTALGFKLSHTWHFYQGTIDSLDEYLNSDK